MFQYISEILKQFTSAQRILALLILVLTITIITLGMEYINVMTADKQYYIDEINRLNKTIVVNRKSCTDEMIAREMEIVKQIDILKGSLKRPITNEKMIIRDTIFSEAKMVQPRTIQPDNSEVTKGLDNIKSKILKQVSDIKNNN
jgi:hypothetical protein